MESDKNLGASYKLISFIKSKTLKIIRADREQIIIVLMA